ncbi:MAG TPA: urease accessory UreF family protein [Amycolatopsis sp.]|nr:urease accessory UreF family protein [Amycolatopsis sp.]
MNAGILLLADSRLPTGGHAHSGGVESAVETGVLSTLDDLTSFLRGRARTAGPMLAGCAAAACSLAAADLDRWTPWDDAVSVRILVPALREASRAQGAAMLRTALRMWPAAPLLALRRIGRPHLPLVLGAAVAAAGGGPAEAAALALHHLIGGACSATVRLLGLDPIDVAATQARLATLLEEVAAKACQEAETAVSTMDPAMLPADGSPLPDLHAVRHAQQEVTLFAS